MKKITKLALIFCSAMLVNALTSCASDDNNNPGTNDNSIQTPELPAGKGTNIFSGKTISNIDEKFVFGENTVSYYYINHDKEEYNYNLSKIFDYSYDQEANKIYMRLNALCGSNGVSFSRSNFQADFDKVAAASNISEQFYEYERNYMLKMFSLLKTQTVTVYDANTIILSDSFNPVLESYENFFRGDLIYIYTSFFGYFDAIHGSVKSCFNYNSDGTFTSTISDGNSKVYGTATGLYSLDTTREQLHLTFTSFPDLNGDFELRENIKLNEEYILDFTTYGFESGAFTIQN